MRLKILPVTLLLILVTATLHATEKVIDRRNASEANKYFVVFCGKAGLPGHAFVATGVSDYSAKSCRERAFGLYPKSKMELATKLLGTVPGEIVDEALKDGKGATHRLIIKVNSHHAKKIDALRKKWAAKKEYKLVEKDCVSFVEACAKALGLKTPKRTEALLPVTFVKKLLVLNE